MAALHQGAPLLDETDVERKQREAREAKEWLMSVSNGGGPAPAPASSTLQESGLAAKMKGAREAKERAMELARAQQELFEQAG